MQIGLIGINHKSADLILREEVTKALNFRFGTRFLHFFPHVLLSTCNRTELYFSGEDLALVHSFLLSLLRNEIQRETTMEFEHALYSYFGTDCFLHLSKVVSGFDSAIFGETEIQGQVKLAYTEALQERSLSLELNYLFQRALNVGKKMRQLVGCHPEESIATTLWEIASKHFSHLSEKKILFVGASSINQKIARYFKKRGGRNLTLCNRSSERGALLAKEMGISWLPWAKNNQFFEHDTLFFATKAPHYLLEEGHFQPLEKKLLFDLSLPRNVDPACAQVPNFCLYNIDEIQKSVSEKSESVPTRPELVTLSKIVTQEMRRFKDRENKRFLHLAAC